MTTLSFTVYGTPVPAGSKTPGITKGGRRFVRDSSGHRGTDWRRNVAQVAGEALNGRGLFDGPLRLVCRFYMPRPKAHFGAKGLKASAPAYPTSRPDSLKLARGTEDAMSGVVYRDDAQIVSLVATKQYGEPARCEVEIEEID